MSEITTPHSMTGFGSSTKEGCGIRLSIEIKSVNSRFLDINCKLPYAYSSFEIDVKNKLKSYLKRGRVELYIDRKVIDESAKNVTLNSEIFKHYWKLVKDLSDDIKDETILNDKTAMATHILSRPEVITANSENLDDEKKIIFNCIEEAVIRLVEQREVEGKALVSDISNSLDNLSEISNKINSNKDNLLKNIKEKLKTKIQDLLDSVDFSSERIEQEAALIANRSDINEELTRIESHIEQVTECIQKKPEGRKIDFLIQELNREFNTISSKSQNSFLQHQVVSAKLEIEKMREQSLNLE